MTNVKRKMVCVAPQSNIAKLRFTMEMSSLHTCYVDIEVDDMLYLTSINGNYCFTMNRKEDKNWSMVK